MYRIRFHGRGGQGMKTASRILGTAFFLEGYEIQDAPRYGAERRGAPIFAYVRASKDPIYERGVINQPDLVIVADETLVPIPAAGVLFGSSANTTLLINSEENPQTWSDRLNYKGKVLTFDQSLREESIAHPHFVGSICVGAAARLLGVISRESLQKAIEEELSGLSKDDIEKNIQIALLAYDSLQIHGGSVNPNIEISAKNYTKPNWVELPFENSAISAPVIHAASTSEEVKTGLWRVMRPIIDYERCHHCWWICSTFCPDSAIHVDDEKKPVINYDFCKGCLICSTICPSHAIDVIPEHDVADSDTKGGQK